MSTGAAPAIDEAAIRSATDAPAGAPESVLMLGWNDQADTVLRELSGYVAPGSSATVVADAFFTAHVAALAQFENMQVAFRAGDTTDRALLDQLQIVDFDHVIVLADKRLHVQDADAAHARDPAAFARYLAAGRDTVLDRQRDAGPAQPRTGHSHEGQRLHRQHPYDLADDGAALREPRPDAGLHRYAGSGGLGDLPEARRTVRRAGTGSSLSTRCWKRPGVAARPPSAIASSPSRTTRPDRSECTSTRASRTRSRSRRATK